MRKILGFLPAGFWLFWFLYAGLFGEEISPDRVTWSIANIPWNLRIYLGLEVCSGILLCFRKTILPGLVAGILPWIHFLFFVGLSFLPGLIIPICGILYYGIYTFFWWLDRRSLN